MLSRQLRIDAFGRRVRITEICPGRIATDIFAHVHGDSPETRERFLDGFELTREECESLIMQARLKAGWITEADLAPPPAEEAPAEETEPAS